MATCYCPPSSGNGTTLSICGADSVPCSSKAGTYNSTSDVSLCCASGDTCGANSICYMKTLRQPLGTGYYLGGCTDSTFKDPLCRSDCAGSATENIAYQADLDVWSCCGVNGTGAVDCSKVFPQLSFQALYPPEDFPGPVNEQLTPAAIGTSFATSMTSTSTSSASSAKAAPATSQPSSTITALNTSGSTANRTLSTGAKAGIGIGAAIAGLLIVALTVAVLLLLRRRRAFNGTKQDVSRDALPYESKAELEATTLVENDSVAPGTQEADEAYGVHEADPTAWMLGTHERRAELENPRVPHEMEASSSSPRRTCQ